MCLFEREKFGQPFTFSVKQAHLEEGYTRVFKTGLDGRLGVVLCLETGSCGRQVGQFREHRHFHCPTGEVENTMSRCRYKDCPFILEGRGSCCQELFDMVLCASHNAVIIH